MSYYPEPYTYNKNKIKIYLDLSNYAAKSDLKNEIGVNTSKCTKEVGLSDLKSNIDKWDVDKLETTPVDLSK